MATPIIMPKQGQSVESCILTTWFKKVGDRVAEGDLLFAYETDKTAFDEEASVSGVLLARFFEEARQKDARNRGLLVKGSLVCFIGKQQISFCDTVSHLLKPGREYAALHALALLRHDNWGCHCSSTSP